MDAPRSLRLRLEGTVQGVGFRPHVHRLASELGLSGLVRNDPDGVVVEAEGPPAALEALLERVAREAPPLARIERVEVAWGEATGARGFVIAASDRAGAAAAVTQDSATCADCLAELRDPRDRRHRYPFINCTNCGPRFTIVRGTPYDRPFTTMAAFAMCARCRAEYEDPADRRFHAQPNACPHCGPAARLIGPDGVPAPLAGAPDAVAAAARALLAGAIVAVKGIGGYHLACRADDEHAVATLRSRKHREERPFALLVPHEEAARALVHAGPLELALLRSPARPIVLAPRRERAAVAPSVAPHSAELGVLLPYSPLHHLLAGDAAIALVLTSGNRSDEPIAFRDDDALARLAPIADLLLVHDREIATRADDSVARVLSARRPRATLVRRSRGYVPASLPLPGSPAPLLACGAQQKHTFTLARNGRAWVSPHIGDLANWETLRSLRDGVEHLCRLFEVAPETVAHDRHPGYLSTAYALDRDAPRTIAVQHHHAHLAACLAEHGHEGPAVGAIFDGTGYGTDGTVWGGEILAGTIAAAQRAGSLLAVPMPGGAAAIREPWRMACAWLSASGIDEPPAALAAEDWGAVRAVARSPELSPLTSSAGRLFDAVAAICGIRARVTYEGQAAVELEAAASAAGRSGAYEVELLDGDTLTLDPRPAIREIAGDVRRGVAAGVVAARFHAGLARAAASAVIAVAARRGLDTAVLSGGAFQNRLLLEDVAGALERAGLRVLVPELLPVNDGGISYGQAAVAAAN